MFLLKYFFSSVESEHSNGAYCSYFIKKVTKVIVRERALEDANTVTAI